MHNLSVLVVFNLNKLSLAVLEECIHMQNRALFLVWEGPFPPDSGCLYIYPVFTARFWIRADLINSSFPLPPGPGLFSALSAVPSPPFPLPGFPELSLGTCAGQRVWNPPIPPCLCPFASYHTMTCWVFLNKEQIWVLIYKS